MLSNNIAYYSSLESNVQFDNRRIAEKSLQETIFPKLPTDLIEYKYLW